MTEGCPAKEGVSGRSGRENGEERGGEKKGEREKGEERRRSCCSRPEVGKSLFHAFAGSVLLEIKQLFFFFFFFFPCFLSYFFTFSLSGVASEWLLRLRPRRKE